MNKKIIFTICILMLLSPQLVFCEEGNNSTEEQTEDFSDYTITGSLNFLVKILGIVSSEECHDLCNLSGSNIAIGIWESSNNNTIDAQVDDSRSELAGRIHIVDSYTTFSEHATKVALIIGSNTDEKADLGMAPNVELYSYDSDDIYTEIANSGVDISTNSWGHGKSWLGNYTLFSSYYFDNVIRKNNITCFKSAGNQNNGSAYNTITSPGTAKNIITVGATTGDLFNDIAYFSSFGPCDDGRLKPEIVAPGYRVVLNGAGYYSSVQGTSYACPVASGSAALVLEEWKSTHPTEDMLPSTMKALLVHTANNDGNGPTYRYGYGMLDTKEAVDLVELDIVETTTIVQDYSTFQSNGSYQTTHDIGVIPDNIGELKVTIAWSDKEGSNPNENYDLYNDLDLVVSKNDGTSNEYYYPWILDPNNEEDPATSSISSTYDPQSHGDYLNPLEQVQIKNPVSGNYSIIIEGEIDSGPQYYSLIITTKPKVNVYSDKEGAEVYVNNDDGFGIADGVIENGVAEICAYAGQNTITINDEYWLSWLLPHNMDINCSITQGDSLNYYAYFDSYTLELQSGLQVISLPFDVPASTLFGSSSVEKIKSVDFVNVTVTSLTSSDTLKKGHSYLVDSLQATTIDIDTETNEFEIVTFDACGLIGAPSVSTPLCDMLSNGKYDVNSTIVYRYNETSDAFDILHSNSSVNPGDALFVISDENSGVNI